MQLGIHTAQVWLDQVQGDHHAQVVEHADSAAQYQGRNQPPLVGFDTGSDDVELADETRGQRDTGQGQHHHGQYGGQVRAAPEQAAILVQGVSVTAFVRRGHQRNYTEGAEAGDHVGDQVNADGFHGQAFARHQGDQQVAEVSDGRVTQQTLEVVLGQGQQVTEQDRRDGDHGQHVAQHAGIGSRRDLEQTHHHGKHSNLGRGSQERSHRRRGAFVHVWGPQVERHERQLECQADQHHRQAQLGNRRRAVGGSQRVADTGEAQAAGFGVEQGHAEQQERRACGRQHHVLDAGFQGALVEEGVGHQAVGRDRQQFQADEQARQVLCADQHDATGRSQQDQQVQFFAVAWVAGAAFAEVGVGEGDASQCGHQDQRDVQQGKVIDHHQWRNRQWCDLEGRNDRQQGQVQPGAGQQERLRVIAAPGDGQHHRNNGEAGNQQRRKRDKVLDREFHSALTGPKRVERRRCRTTAARHASSRQKCPGTVAGTRRCRSAGPQGRAP